MISIILSGILSFSLQILLIFITAIPAGMGLGLGLLVIKKITKRWGIFKRHDALVSEFTEMEKI